MDVKKLPVDVQCLLTASARVNNYKRVVEELVYNSLDAESTCIAIRIHVQNKWIQVVDNGIGIKEADFKLLGERNATSKLFDLNTLKAVPSKYGYRGQAIANIIEVSHTVTITSRSTDSKDTWVKTFLLGKKDRECFKTTMRPSRGTTIEIDGFLYNLNIQNKNINGLNELQDIKTFLEQLLLIFNNVSISVRDDSINEIIFKMHKSRDIYQTLKSIFDIDTKDIQKLQVEKNEYKVKAFIGIEKKSFKNCHWIYLNNKFINISNLHRTINNKFAKAKGMKYKKVRIMGENSYDKESTNACKLVPFYFLFISCPYYEYDIVDSGKEIVVEFKNWMQIDKLLDKLLKFYYGDINLIDIKKNVCQKQDPKKVESSREEVKKIIERILGKPNKIVKLTQVQNGIRGKQARRKKKKQQVNISFSKIIPPKNNTLYNATENFDNVNLSVNKVVDKTPKKHYNANMQSKPTKLNLKSKNKANNKCRKKYRNISKCKCFKKVHHLMEIFNNDNYSIEKQYNKLLTDAKDSLNIVNPPVHTNYVSIDQMKNEYSVAVNAENMCVIKEHDIDINNKYSDTVQYKRYSNNNNSINKIIRSYDLLQTVMRAQRNFHYQEPKKEETFIAINRSDLRRQALKNNHYGPKLTFESHTYNINSNIIGKKVHQKVQFISKQSRDKFDIGVNKYKENIQKTRKNFKRNGLFSTKIKMKHDVGKISRLLNKHKQDELETPFSIDMLGTEVVEVSKQIRNQIMNDINPMLLNGDCGEIHSTISRLNFGINLNVEKTYTVLMDTVDESFQAINVKHNYKSCKDQSACYINRNNHESIRSNHDIKTSSIIFTSQTQYITNTYVEEPLDVCEVIMNSSTNVEHVSNNTFNMPRPDASLIIKKSSNINKSVNDNSAEKLQVKSYDIGNNKASQDGISTSNGIGKIQITKPTYESLHRITHKNEKLLINVNNSIQDNSHHDFNLNSRHRFVPKGMSQIFKNCFSKNICSYNLDTDYYENKIYDNFVEDVAVNSAIFVPTVQNVKEFTTGDVQKFTERIKKQNADLIFGPDSLRNAKVLGQVDCKFIAAIILGRTQNHKSQELFVLFDQHAVDERIRLEENLSYYINNDTWKKVTIDTVSMKCSKDEILYLHNHKDKFTRFGLEWTILNNSEIFVHAIPEAIRGKLPRSMEVILKAVKDLILEQMHAIKYQKGNVSLYPQSIMNLVFSEACRHAIKFGDSISKRDCCELITALAKCKTPFQCAHGRPVMAVMLELKKKQIEYKVNMKNIMQFKNGIH